MTSLKEASLAYKGKKELSDLNEISVNIEIKQDEFDADNGQKRKYNYVEIDGYKYTVRAPVLKALKGIIQARPQTTKIKVSKTEGGEYVVIPLD